MLLPFTEERDDDVIDNPSTLVHATHAIQNHRTRTDPPAPKAKSPVRVQQVFTFDDGTEGTAIPGIPSDLPGRASIEATGSIAGPALSTSGRDSDKSTPGRTAIDGSKPDLSSRSFERTRRSSQIQTFLKFDAVPEAKPTVAIEQPLDVSPSSGEKAKARDIVAAIRTLKHIEDAGRNPTFEERQQLAKFTGFGAVARSLFPDPVTGHYKDASWETLGKELECLLSSDEYQSAKRTTFNAFYTSRKVIQAMYRALDQLGTPEQALILEPGCGSGKFMSLAPSGKRFIGVELDTTSGRIARALHTGHDIRIENFRDSKLPEGHIDAVIGNVPFANIKLDHKGEKYSLHDYFFVKSLDALKPGGVLALVTSHYTLDKQNASVREYIAGQADFLGAIRLPDDAFKNEGTKVVTDIIFLKKREAGQSPAHADKDWLATGTKEIGNTSVSVNRYFLSHPEMVLGNWTIENQLYGQGFSITGSGNLERDLDEAVKRLPSFAKQIANKFESEPVVARFNRPPPVRHVIEGSYYVGDDQIIYQIEGGVSHPVTHGSTPLTANGTMMGKRLASLITLRDAARLVLQSQNDAWPEGERDKVRRELNLKYDRFVHEYGPINKTTFSESTNGSTTRRMPNLVKFKDDPDAMLVMALEDYDEVAGKAEKVSIFHRDVVGRKDSVVRVKTAEEALIVSLDQTGGKAAGDTQLFSELQSLDLLDLVAIVY